VAQRDPDALVAVLPADAFVDDVEAFRSTLMKAFETAQTHGAIVCLGIKPTFAATGYGYIRTGPSPSSGVPRVEGNNGSGSAITNRNPRPIEQFFEKPDVAHAQRFFKSGDYFWNAGIFVFSARVFQEETRKHAPEFAVFFDKNIGTSKRLKSGYRALPKVAVDVALMEKTDRGFLVQGDFGWNDIGSWPALAEVLKNNSVAGIVNAKSGHIAIDSDACVVDVTDGKFVGLIGVRDLIVVETSNALLVCHKDSAQKIKDLVGEIAKIKKLKVKLL